MQFDFKKYITEKYLVERLQSDTLVHQLLNDKGGMFTYYKMPYPGTIYQKALACYSTLNNWIKQLFVGWKQEFQKDGFQIGITKIDTDEKIKKFHEIYMNKVEEYKDLTSKLFIKPDPQILSALINGVSTYSGKFEMHRKDIYNITDEFFTQYTWKQLKKDKQLCEKVKDQLNSCVAFWMSDGKILGVSKQGYLNLYSIDNDCEFYVKEENGRRFEGKLTPEIIEDAVNKDNLIVNTLKGTLNDGTELEWPTVSRQSFIGDRQDLCGIDFVNKFLNLNQEIQKVYSGGYKFKAYNIGKFISHGSPLAKATNWGDNEDDYVILYEPNDLHMDATGNVKSTYLARNGEHRVLPKSSDKSYNDMKAGKEFSEKNKKRKDDFDEQQESVYKWVKDLFGKYQPYAGGKNSKMFEFGKKLSEYDYESLYGNDGYCNKIALQNIQRYKFIIQQNRSVTGISEFTDKLKDISKDVQSFGVDGKKLCGQLKALLLKDMTKYRELTFLYGEYMTMLNQMLSKFGKVQAKVSQFKNDHQNGKRKAWKSEDTHTEIKRDRERIERDIKDLQTNREEMKQLHEKIKTTMDE